MNTPGLKYFALVLVAVVGSGCIRVGPEYESPELKWTDEWETEMYREIGDPLAQTGFDLRFWWLLFNDPVLNDLIELAKQENPVLQIAGLRILEARAALGIATSLKYPQVQQVTGAIDVINTKSSGESVQTNVTPRAAFNVGWEIDFWGKFARYAEAADASFFGFSERTGI